MNLKLTFIAIFTTVCTGAFAQQTEKTALANGIPEIAVTPDSSGTSKNASQTVVKTPEKVRLSLEAGTMFSSYGNATYLAPRLHYRLNNKFSVFSGVTYLNNNFLPFAFENRPPMATKHYLVHVGGAYDVSEKLRLSGSVWRDFSGFTGQPDLFSGLKMPAAYGTEFNASYKFNENFSIHGSIRTSHGNNFSPYGNRFNAYNTGFSPAAPFGY